MKGDPGDLIVALIMILFYKNTSQSEDGPLVIQGDHHILGQQFDLSLKNLHTACGASGVQNNQEEILTTHDIPAKKGPFHRQEVGPRRLPL